MSQRLNMPNVPRSARLGVIRHSVRVTHGANIRIRFRRIDATVSFSTVHGTGTRNLPVAYRATPRCITLYSRTLLGCNALTGVGPPLHSRRSHGTAVTTMTSNAISLLTASRTPRAVRRGSLNFLSTPGNVVNLRYTCNMYRGVLISNNFVSSRHLVRLVSATPTRLVNRDGTSIATLLSRCTSTIPKSSSAGHILSLIGIPTRSHTSLIILGASRT